MAKPYLSKSGGRKGANKYRTSGANGNSSPQVAWRDSPADMHIPAHTPSHFKKFSLKGVKGS